MKIVILTQWFDPEPTPKGLAFARKLLEQGHDVEVVTGFPNYPVGRVYDGYRIRWRQCEEIDGVNITRLALYPSHDSSAVKRAMNYLSFMCTAMIYGLFSMSRPDVLYVYHPPATVGVAAAVVQFFRRVPFVYDIQDLWPDTLAATGMLRNDKALRIIGTVCRWIYRRAAHVVVLSDGFRDRLIDCGVDKDTVTVIPNWCDETAIVRSEPKDGVLPDGFNILFAGNVGFAQALDAVVEAADIVKNDERKINLVVLGSGVDVARLKAEVGSRGCENVSFLPRVPMNEVGPILSAADVLLVHLKDDDLFRITIPSKIQAYMSIGKPVLVGVRGDAATLVSKARAGLECIPENADSIAEAFRTFAKMPVAKIEELGQNARDYYLEHLSLAKGTDRFIEVFERAAKSG